MSDRATIPKEKGISSHQEDRLATGNVFAASVNYMRLSERAVKVKMNESDRAVKVKVKDK